MEMADKEIDKVAYKILTLFFLIIIGLLIKQKYDYTELKQYEYYTVGKVEKVYHGKARSVDFSFVINGIKFKRSSSMFMDNISQTGTQYFVIVNKYDSNSALILGFCPYDKTKHIVPKEGLYKIPDTLLQKKVDKAFEEYFNSTIVSLLPPYQ